MNHKHKNTVPSEGKHTQNKNVKLQNPHSVTRYDIWTGKRVGLRHILTLLLNLKNSV